MEDISQPVIAFPVRVNRGLLQKTDERDAYLTLLGVMARTPQGSWMGHPLFGFRDFFTQISKDGLSREVRMRISETTAAEINAVLADLGLTRYCVESLTPDSLDKEIYNVENASRLTEKYGVTLTLRENGSSRTARYAL
jgi:DNA-directed RNA polymerase subunit N (RpoN/RPB10)